MIHRSITTGEKLDVAGLNEITVLIDRSETRLTEVAMNSWSPGLDGPPHAHDRKEQNFLVTAGRGQVVIGRDRFPAAPGDFFYVPAGVVHQTINLNADARLDYFLFNAFLDADKEGHASFSDHIAKVKETRRQQAAAQKAEVDPGTAAAAPSRPGRHVSTAGLTAWSTTLLNRTATERCEAIHHCISGGHSLALPSDPRKEQTFYVTAGSGRFTVDNETVEVASGQVVFAPCGAGCTAGAGPDGLTMISFGTVVQR